MSAGFKFEHDGREYICTVEERKAAPAGKWWWFAVSRDQQRYAPFEATSHDSERSVQKRIIAYYENLLEVRARPVVPRQHWARRGKPEAPAKS
jgi:hypothetical protein